MSIRATRRLAAALLSAVLLTPASSAVAAPGDEDSGSVEGGAAIDRTGDVRIEGTDPVYPPDLDRIDLTETAWQVNGHRARFTLHVVNLVGGKHHATYGVMAFARADTVFLDVRGKRVLVADADRTAECEGARVRRDRERDVLRFSVPLRCLDTSDTYRFQSVALLEERDGGDLASDTTRRTDEVTIR